MTTFRLNIAVALEEMYRQVADRGAHDGDLWNPAHYPVAVTGLKKFYQDLSEELETPRDRSPGLHLSDVTGEIGWECDRYLFFVDLQEPQPPKFRDDLIRTFEVGKGMHLQLFTRIVPAIEMKYGPRVKVLDFKVEEPAPDDGSGITGTMDVWIELLVYDADAIGDESRAQRVKVVIDVKSTSVNESSKRKRGQTPKQSTEREVTGDPKYLRQVSTYVTRSDSDYAILLFWEKQFPHRFSQTTRARNDRVYQRVLKRVGAVRQHIADMTLPAPNRRVCSGCPYRDRCPQ